MNLYLLQTVFMFAGPPIQKYYVAIEVHMKSMHKYCFIDLSPNCVNMLIGAKCVKYSFWAYHAGGVSSKKNLMSIIDNLHYTIQNKDWKAYLDFILFINRD